MFEAMKLDLLTSYLLMNLHFVKGIEESNLESAPNLRNTKNASCFESAFIEVLILDFRSSR